MLVGLAPIEAADLEFEAIVDEPGGEHTEGNVRRIQPVMADRRFGRVHYGLAMHEGRRAERRLAGQASIEKQAALPPDVLGNRCRKLHEEVVWMLAVNEMFNAIRSLSAGQQQRIAALTHDRVRTDGRLQMHRATPDRSTRRAHQHP